MKTRICWLAVLFLALPRLAVAQDGPEVFKTVSDDRVEGVLRGLKIEFEKKSNDKEKTVWVYERNGFKMRLINYAGTDLMIDAEFDKAALETLNAWNTRTKFTRAVLYKDKQGEF